MIFTAFALPVFIAEEELVAYSYYQIQYHQKMDNAIDDALYSMVEKDTYEEVTINKEECISNFYQSFYGNFGVENTVVTRNQIRQHIPMIGVVERDRFSIAYQQPVQKNGNWELTDAWTKEVFYEYEENGIRYQFQLGDKKDWVKVCFLYKNRSTESENIQWIEGFYKELAKRDIRFFWMANEEQFEQVRRNTILCCIKQSMEMVSNEYNQIGKRGGFLYEFHLPNIEKQDWCRTIDDIGIMVLFQGYPVQGTIGKTYTRFVYSGARTYKQKR